MSSNKNYESMRGGTIIVAHHALSKQCLDRRIAKTSILNQEVRTWSKRRNQLQTKITWQFTKNNAREKLGKHYDIISN